MGAWHPYFSLKQSQAAVRGWPDTSVKASKFKLLNSKSIPQLVRRTKPTSHCANAWTLAGSYCFTERQEPNFSGKSLVSIFRALFKYVEISSIWFEVWLETINWTSLHAQPRQTTEPWFGIFINSKVTDRLTWALAAMGAWQANFSINPKPGSGHGLTWSLDKIR